MYDKITKHLSCAGQGRFFAAIAECRDVQCPVPLERWDLEAWYAPDIPPRRMVSYTRFAAFCTDIDRFEVRVISVETSHASIVLTPHLC